MQLPSTTLTPTSSAASSQYVPLVTQEERNAENLLTELLNIHENSIETLQAANQATDCSLQDMRQALARIETTLGNSQHAGVTEQVLSYFIGQIDELNESLKQKNQAIEAADQEKTGLKESLEAKEKECTALRQELETNKQICEEEHQVALKLARKFEAIQQLKDPAWQIREKAISTLSGLSDLPADMEQYIAPLLKDPAWQVRKAAFYVVGWRFSVVQLEQEVTPLLQDQEWSIRQAVMNLLGDRLFILQVEQKITPLLKDPAWQVRQTAVDILGKRLSAARLEQYITPLLKDPAWQVRKISIGILGQSLPQVRLEQEIIPLLKDEALNVQKAVMHVLRQRLSPARLEQEILLLSKNPVGIFREISANLFGELHSLSPQTKEVLIALAQKDPVKSVQNAATCALNKHSL